MPAEYRKIRNSIHQNCVAEMRKGSPPKGKKEDETCMQYAKRVAAATFTKRHGVTPQQAEAQIKLVEDVEKLLGFLADETS